MTLTARAALDLPAGLRPEPIVVRDPFLEFLGLVRPGEPISISFAELVKAAGHVCPTVTGAYLILREGLGALYSGDPAVRGAVRVTAYGGPADFGYGFRRDDIRRNELDFERLDTGRRVRVTYDPSIVPAPADLARSIVPALADGATEAAVTHFRRLWLQRTIDILAAGYRVVNVSEAVEATATNRHGSGHAEEGKREDHVT